VAHHLWIDRLKLLAMLAVLACASPALAQYTALNVVVTSVGSGSYSTGAAINNLGSFSVSNGTGIAVTISSVTVTLSNPSAFASLTLNGTSGGSSQAASAPPASTTTFTFSLPALLPAGVATFRLSGTATSATPSASATATPAGTLLMRDAKHPGYAAIAWPSAAAPPVGLMALAAIGLLFAAGRLRRRHLVLLAAGAILAATQLGCGNVGLFGSSGSSSGYTSTQRVTALGVSSGGTVIGLPVSLGTISVN